MAVADFVDLKSPYTLGHARAVSDLAAKAGAQLGLTADDVHTLRRAGLVHDLGRLGVSNAIWDKAGPLGDGEWERVRMHPYLTERMLHQSSVARPTRRHRRAAPGAPRRLGLSPGTGGRGHQRAGPDPRRGRRLRVDARAATVSSRRSRRGRPRRNYVPRSRRNDSMQMRPRRSSRPPGTG